MKKNLLKYIFVIIGILSFLIVYLSVFGLETEKFNSQIKNKIYQIDKNFEVELRKIKFNLNPVNFKIDVKTIGPKVLYKKKTYSTRVYRNSNFNYFIYKKSNCFF